MRVGVLSDTHGTLPDGVLEAFAGVERIIHAGDVGNGLVLETLATVAPVVAVRGNCDLSGEPAMLPPLANTRIGDLRFLVVHRPADVPRPLPEGIDVVVTGHTHVPQVADGGGVLWVNPGSPSQSRRESGHHVAIVEWEDCAPEVRIVDLP